MRMYTVTPLHPPHHVLLVQSSSSGTIGRDGGEHGGEPGALDLEEDVDNLAAFDDWTDDSDDNSDLTDDMAGDTSGEDVEGPERTEATGEENDALVGSGLGGAIASASGGGGSGGGGSHGSGGLGGRAPT